MLLISFCFSNNYAGKSNQSNQVRQSHQTVNDIGHNPDFFQFQERTAGNKNDETDAVRKNCFNTHQVFYATFAVIVPAEDGSEGEEHQANQQQPAAESREGGSEGCISHCSTVEFTVPNAGNNQGQTGHGADDDGIDKGTGHGNQTLFSRPISFSSSRYDRSRA